MGRTVTVFVPGDVTEIVMLPLAPAVAVAVNVTERVSPPPVVAGGSKGGPDRVRHPMVQDAPGPVIVPMAHSAVTLIVVPAAIGLVFKSSTLKAIEPEVL